MTPAQCPVCGATSVVEGDHLADHWATRYLLVPVLR